MVAKLNGVGAESVHRWFLQAQVDSGQRRGASSDELAEFKNLKAKVRRVDAGLAEGVTSTESQADLTLGCVKDSGQSLGSASSVDQPAGSGHLYNTRRRHSALDMLTFTVFETLNTLQLHHA